MHTEYTNVIYFSDIFFLSVCVINTSGTEMCYWEVCYVFNETYYVSYLLIVSKIYLTDNLFLDC